MKGQRVDKTPETIGAVGTAIAGILGVLYKWRERKLKHEEIVLERESSEEDREIEVLTSHVQQLQLLWESSLQKADQLRDKIEALHSELVATRAENAELKAEVRELRTRLEHYEQTTSP